MNNNYTVYIHTNKTNKKVYIGITSNSVTKRWKNGKGYVGQQYFYNAILKYGFDGFEHIIFASNLSKNRAYEMETKLILLYNSNKRKFGYNITSGGEGITGFKFTEESKKKMSVSKLGNKNPFYGKKHTDEYIHNAKIRITGENNPMFNRTHTDEVRQYISKCNSGANNPRAKKLIQLDKDTEDIIKIWDYAKQAADSLGVDLSNISKCCKGKIKTLGGYKWEYK